MHHFKCPIIRFEESYPIYGRADTKDGNKILVRHDVPFKEILHTIAHEAHHQWFCQKYGKTYLYGEDKDMWEDTADMFVGKMLRELREQDEFENDENLQLIYSRYWYSF